MTYRKLLLDVDGTLLNFNASAEIALKMLFAERGYPYSDHVFDRYEAINLSLWEQYERGEIPRDQVLTERFTILFGKLGICENGADFEHDFRTALEDHPVWMEGAVEILDYLKPKYDLYIVTNGVARTQQKRLGTTGLDRYMKDIFISELIGAQKPQKAFFDHVLQEIGHCDPQEVLLIGDSLTADILGANNAGIPACWFNPEGKPSSGPGIPDIEIRNLSELRDIL